MKKTFILLTMIMSSLYADAQTFEMEIDHTAIMVKNLDSSAVFYSEIMKFKEIETPWGVIDWGKFFEISPHQQLHMALIGENELKLNKMIHLAFSVNEFDAYIKFLDSKGVEWGNFKGSSKEVQIRPDNVRQVYFQDPDGYWIEVNDNKN